MRSIKYMVSFFVSILLFVMTSCQDLDYRKACEEKDFVKAYQIVDKLKDEIYDEQTGEGDWGREERVKAARERAEEAERYVVFQEAIMVLENNGKEGLLRIVVIAKEHQAESWLYNDILDMVTATGDTTLIEKIKSMI